MKYKEARQKLEAEKDIIRKKLQELLNKLCDEYKKKHIPLYLSLKPKLKLGGLFIVSNYNRNIPKKSIVIFPIRLKIFNNQNFENSEVEIRKTEELKETLLHEFTHYLIGLEQQHNRTFKETFFKLLKQYKNYNL